MDSKEKEDHVKSVVKSREKLLKLQQNIENATSGSSASTLADLQNLSKEIQLHLMKTATAHDPNKSDPSKATSHIKDELDKVFTVEEVGHKCDLCERDLASDPERPNASLRTLQEACVLECGHVYHFKCLKGTTLDLDNRSTNPSCIFCNS
ncbi:RING-type domain-containing protein [Hirschfeldia incana]|nr:RING-type domain-containing protein [Hirschfeldia incana]